MPPFLNNNSNYLPTIFLMKKKNILIITKPNVELLVFKKCLSEHNLVILDEKKVYTNSSFNFDIIIINTESLVITQALNTIINIGNKKRCKIIVVTCTELKNTTSTFNIGSNCNFIVKPYDVCQVIELVIQKVSSLYLA